MSFKHLICIVFAVGLLACMAGCQIATKQPTDPDTGQPDMTAAPDTWLVPNAKLDKLLGQVADIADKTEEPARELVSYANPPMAGLVGSLIAAIGAGAVALRRGVKIKSGQIELEEVEKDRMQAWANAKEGWVERNQVVNENVRLKKGAVAVRDVIDEHLRSKDTLWKDKIAPVLRKAANSGAIMPDKVVIDLDMGPQRTS